MKKLGLIVLAAALFATPGMSRGYGDAGCGLGSVFFGAENGFLQFFAATTNGSSGNQTFAITSGTSNCDSDSMGKSEQLRQYVQANQFALANDIARGRGETISALSEVFECSDSSQLGRSLQVEFDNIFPGDGSNEPREVANTIEEVVSQTDGCQLS